MGMDIILGVILFVDFIYLKRNEPIGEILFESRTLSYFGIIIDISLLLLNSLLKFLKCNDIYSSIFIILLILSHLMHSKNKLFIYNNDFYFNNIFGVKTHLGKFSELIQYNITEKGRLKLEFEGSNGDSRCISIPGKFNESEIYFIKSIFYKKGFEVT